MIYISLLLAVLAAVEINDFQAQTAPTTGLGFSHQLATIDTETNYQTIGSTIS